MNKHRVLFSFSEQSYRMLQDLQKDCGYSSMAEVIRDALSLFGAVRGQVKQSFHEIVLRNPSSGNERILVPPPPLSRSTFEGVGPVQEHRAGGVPTPIEVTARKARDAQGRQKAKSG